MLAFSLCQSAVAQSESAVPITVGDITTMIDDYLSPDNKGRITVEDISALIDRYLQQGVSNCPDSNHPHAIDLGLPSGTKWACCNIGASSPEGYGGYYAWGETEEKSVYGWDTYKYGSGYGELTKYSTRVDNKTQLDLSDDVAYVKWGGSWRMPTIDHQNELLNNCSSEWAEESGVSGRRFTGPNGASVFLPAAGHDLYSAGLDGNYWSSSLTPNSEKCAFYLCFTSSLVLVDGYYFLRPVGLSVRAVCP